ncbi:hypothetical protein N824_15040 [Pedobacter sp. V48]|nr:hypothetical protein N824_15040 [Pedobacter sp. V48]
MEVYLNLELYHRNIGNHNYNLDIFDLSGAKLVTEEQAAELIETSGLPLLKIEDGFSSSMNI